MALYGVIVNIPSFLKKVHNVLQNNRRVSSKRVHIERFFRLDKTYKIFSSPLNSLELLLSSDILFVCSFLCNFQKEIVNQ